MQTKTKGTLNARPSEKAIKRYVFEAFIVIVIMAPVIVLCVYWKQFIISRIYKEIELKPNQKGYNVWSKPPITITRDYYLFNITNPIEIVTKPASTTVHVKEMPPYSYLLSSTKRDIQWSNDNTEISYSIYRVFARHPTKFDWSSVNDTGTFIDFVRAIFRTQFGIKPAPSFYTFAGMNPFYHRNAVEQLEGFTSELFDLVRDKLTGPNTDKSGFIYRYNGSRTYNFTIKAGLLEKGQVLAFASENVPFSFSSPNYYNVTIYDGLTFVPMLFDKPSLNIFQPDFCRPVNARFNKVVTMFGGINVHEYVIRLVDFEQCVNSSDIDTCPEFDKLDISQCISSSLPAKTVFVSKPHFYGSNNETMNKMKIQGFTPKHDKNEALIYFEPYSGTPLRAHHRVQMNINALIDQMETVGDESELKPKRRRSIRRMLPIVWIDQEVNVDAATLRLFRLVHLALDYGQLVLLVLAGVLVIIIIVIIEVLAYRASKRQRMKRGGSPKSAPLL